MKVRTLCVVGSRPQLLKVSRKWADIIVNTGQHYDKNMNDIHSPKVNYNLKETELGKMIDKLIPILEKEKPSVCIVIGDTRSTLAGTVAASYVGVPVVHYEAGMRSGEDTVEERIRIIVDRIASTRLVTDEFCIDNLNQEGIVTNNYYVGDVMFDRMFSLFPTCSPPDHTKYKPIWKNKEKTPYCFLTLHRPELVDNKEKLEIVLKALEATKKRFIFPIHPRTALKLKEFNLGLPKGIEVVRPMDYMDTLRHIVHAEKVVTDSGGVQRESFWLQKPTIIIRNNTEYKDILEYMGVLTGFDKKKIIEAVTSFNPRPMGHPQKGRAHERIASFFEK